MRPWLCPLLALFIDVCTRTELCKARGPIPAKIFPATDSDQAYGNYLKGYVKRKATEPVADAEAALLALDGEGTLSVRDFFVLLNQASLGAYSSRKGAGSMLASMPGGPGVVPIILRMDQTIGDPQKVYLLEIEQGDAFCGRAVGGIPITDPEFLRIPPHFRPGSPASAVVSRLIPNYGK
jgi:hypothetical protein